MEAGSARIVESAIYDDHLFFLPIARMHQVPDCHPSPFFFSKKCRLGSKFTVRALLCAPSASFRFRLSYFERPSRRSFSRAKSASFNRSKTDRRNPERRTCFVFAILPSQEITTRRNYNATQRWQKNVAQLLAMAERAELLSEDWSRLLRLRRRVFGRSKPSTFPWRLCRLSFLQKKKRGQYHLRKWYCPLLRGQYHFRKWCCPKRDPCRAI